MNLRKILFFTLPLLVLGSGIGFAQQTKKVVGGPELGSQIKSFTLVDQKGKKQELKTFLKNGPVALVFYRSADW